MLIVVVHDAAEAWDVGGGCWLALGMVVITSIDREVARDDGSEFMYQFPGLVSIIFTHSSTSQHRCCHGPLGRMSHGTHNRG